MSKPFVFAVLVALSIAIPANAAYVTPKIGGGGASIPGVGMIDVAVSFVDINSDGTKDTLAVEFPSSYETPLLRPLAAPDAFDPSQLYYSALNGKAYNYQYSWSSADDNSLASLPQGSGVWVKRVSQTAGLQTYYRSAYTEILAADGSIWKWGLGMQHNAYAVLNPTESHYEAHYEVFIGDAMTGTPLAGYNGANVTWAWNATPVPEPSGFGLLAIAIGVMSIIRYGRRRGVRVL